MTAPAREYRRILLEELDAYRQRGWTPAVVRGGAVGVTPAAGGDVLEVLIWREAATSPEEIALRAALDQVDERARRIRATARAELASDEP